MHPRCSVRLATRGRSAANIRGTVGVLWSRLFRNRRLLLLLLLIGATSILRPLQNAFVVGDIDRGWRNVRLAPKYLRRRPGRLSAWDRATKPKKEREEKKWEGWRKDKRREGKKSRRSDELTRATVPGVCVSSLVQPPCLERRGETRGEDEPRLNLGYEKGACWRTRCHRRCINAENEPSSPFNYTIFLILSHKWYTLFLSAIYLE